MYYPYIEFKVNMLHYPKGKNILFIGLIDKTMYKYEQIYNKNWKDSPCVLYWDVGNGMIMKTNEQGTQMGPLKAVNFDSADTSFIIGIKYDFRTRCVSLYKNLVNIGVGFKNVPCGLTPLLDIWFETGSVQICKQIRTT